MTILVTGGKGTTAKPLAEVLKKNNIPFLVASRSSSGQGQVRFDWCDESTYELPFQAATDPITAIYMVAPKVPDVFERMKAFIDFARGKGVKRFVLLSATPVPMGGPMYGKVHEYLTQIGVEYGVVRPTWFMDNLIMDVFNKEIIDKGQISSGAKNGKLPWVSAEDIAAVAYRLLTDEKPHNTDYTVRGPELLTYDQVSLFQQFCWRKISQLTHYSPIIGRRNHLKGDWETSKTQFYIRRGALSEIHRDGNK
ncbi:hypothetical protein, variant [Exophiala mesophila]|uniref:NAD(P)-binding domain-containing protein n=1 Tax=Exophiala mesophila TaxID=212818 RepID=A0A0D1ZL40_EXOME|nr:hypothetical protein, variant [Exophiala mesophila]KIV95362.1 hypothetical protein, variant [Exophiala mesophila]